MEGRPFLFSVTTDIVSGVFAPLMFKKSRIESSVGETGF